MAAGPNFRATRAGNRQEPYLMMPSVFRFLRDKSGVTAIEYALIASLIAIVIVAFVRLLGIELSAKFTSLAGDFS
jgi:pilus assembly protein Flp/PilA